MYTYIPQLFVIKANDFLFVTGMYKGAILHGIVNKRVYVLT